MSATRLLIAVMVVVVVAACGQRQGVHPVAARAVPNERVPSEAATAQPPRVASVATAAPTPQPATPAATAAAEELPVAGASEPVEATHAEQPVKRPREEREPVQPVTDRPSPAADEAAPSEEPTETDDDGAQLWNRRFRSYLVTMGGEERELVSGTAIAIRFVPQRAGGQDRDGVAWYTGCNWTGGPLVVRPRQLIIRGEGSTAVGCHPEYQRQEDWVDAFMEGDPMWTLDGRELTLLQGSTTISMREVPDRS